METATTALIAFAITGEIDTALLISGIELFLKIGIYHLQKRFWVLLTLVRWLWWGCACC